MKPKPNEWLYRGDGGDGVEDYLCLRCGGEFALRRPALKTFDADPASYEHLARFCPLCGTKWDGERAATRSRKRARRPADQAFWQYRPHERAASLWFTWAIEVQSRWPFYGPPPADYKDWWRLGLDRRATAAEIRRELAVEREMRTREDDVEGEVIRARLVPSERPRLP